jgi:hypothetical protein
VVLSSGAIHIATVAVKGRRHGQSLRDNTGEQQESDERTHFDCEGEKRHEKKRGGITHNGLSTPPFSSQARLHSTFEGLSSSSLKGRQVEQVTHVRVANYSVHTLHYLNERCPTNGTFDVCCSHQWKRENKADRED